MAWSKEERKIYRHEYYIKNMDREKELMKIYRENNPEKVRELHDNWVEDNRDKVNEYNKEYAKQFEHEAVYLLANVNQEILYLGSCNNLYKRINGKHKCGHSNLKLTNERWEDLQCSHFEFCHLDNVNIQERLFIEKKLIEKHNPILNHDTPLKDESCISDARKAELEIIMDDIVWKLWTK